MEDKNMLSMKEQRLRRQRINRMKSMILLVIGGWILLSMIICIVLLVQTFRMNHKMDMLEEEYRIVQEELSAVKKSSDEQLENAENAENNSGMNPDEQGGVQLIDNQVQEGVRQKVYLTFDDGPSANTAKILDILKEKGVKATFFVVGSEDESNKELYQRIVAEGHTLGMHSYSHKYSVLYDSLESFQDDFNQLRTYLTEITGVKPVIMRFPGGSSNKVSNTDMKEFIRFLNEEGVVYYDWNVSSGDATSKAYTPAELVQNVIKDVKKYDTSIVLMHDASNRETTVEALGPMIDQLLEMDVDLLPIDENTRLIQHIPADTIEE